MSKLTEGAADALQQYEEMEKRRRSLDPKRFPPARTVNYAGVWAPRMTEQQKQEHEQHVKDNNLPF